MSLEGKKILIIISGGIAAYKINFLIRDFVKQNAEVKVVLTPSAEQFVLKLRYPHSLKMRCLPSFIMTTELE
ncbi:hypothetical protein BPO_1072 [Bergeyella porcorum]|uniref:Flavoprotein domain-containing protein n=1 Tax=Bergeyella porcorum TaxID=1735111 RepID=A0AAU0F2N3_9FLAO